MQFVSRSRFARRTRVLALAASAAALALPMSAQADDAYIKFQSPDLTGDVMDKELRGMIPVRNFSWQMWRSSPEHKAQLQGLSIQKNIDATSPALMVATADGRVIPSARLAVRKPGVRTSYLEYCLEHVVLMSDSASKWDAGEPTEYLTMSVGKLSQRYVPHVANVPGTPVSSGWHFSNNSLGAFPGKCGE